MIGKLTRLRVQYCGNGDECPALDRRESGGIEVTGQLVNRPELLPGEATVLAPDTLFPEIVPLHVDLGIRVVDVTETPAASALLEVGDLAVVEGRHVARLRYDTNGDYQGAVAAGDDAAGCYLALAEVAWSLATPFSTWWAEHPQYHRRNTAA